MSTITLKETEGVYDFENFGDYNVYRDGVKLDNYFISNSDCVPECCDTRSWIIVCSECDEDISPLQLCGLPVDTDAEKWELEKLKEIISHHSC